MKFCGIHGNLFLKGQFVEMPLYFYFADFMLCGHAASYQVQLAFNLNFSTNSMGSAASFEAQPNLNTASIGRRCLQNSPLLTLREFLFQTASFSGANAHSHQNRYFYEL